MRRNRLEWETEIDLIEFEIRELYRTGRRRNMRRLQDGLAEAYFERAKEMGRYRVPVFTMAECCEILGLDILCDP